MRLTDIGDITVQVSDELDVRIAGSGAVRYLGKPTVEETIAGSGDVEKCRQLAQANQRHTSR